MNVRRRLRSVTSRPINIHVRVILSFQQPTFQRLPQSGPDKAASAETQIRNMFSDRTYYPQISNIISNRTYYL